jgi:hypothetical protein
MRKPIKWFCLSTSALAVILTGQSYQSHDGFSPAIIRAEAEAHSWSNKVDEVLRIVAEQGDPEQRLRHWQLPGMSIKLVQPEPDRCPTGTADCHTPFSTPVARLPN